MSIKIALAGNPNCGKTTMFNDLTGSNQYVGNWPGVTVEKKEGKLKGETDVIIQDLPGIYSLSPYTLEEVVAREYLVNEQPDAIINIVDGTNIERNLYLTTQLSELGIPMVIALNMIDVVRKNGDVVKLEKLGHALGCQVVETSALKGIGSKEVAQQAIALARQAKSGEEPPHVFEGSVEHALAHIEDAVAAIPMADHLRRWYAIKLFERDEKVSESLKLPPQAKQAIEREIGVCENELDDDAESIITNQRYAYISKIVASCVTKKNRGKLTTSDKIDRVVTNRVLALPIFVLVMAFVYWVSMSSIGSYATTWANEGLFGDGWYLFGNGAWVPGVPVIVSGWLESVHCAYWLQSLIVEGIIGGVGSVLGFVPQMLVLFLLLSILEDVGYMARVAFIMDRIFRRFGLSGKSFIPMLISSGCGVPGVMASRTIENDRDRKMTIMTACFIPCGAKMPIVGLIAGALFGGAWWISVCAYFAGVAAVVISGIILKKTKAFAGEPAPFVMELPPYHVPSTGNVLRSTWERGWSFIKRAGTIILLSSILIWFLSGFGIVNGAFQMVENMDGSILAAIGGAIAPIFSPLGFGTWQSAVATLMGLVAKEEVVSVFGVLYGAAGDATGLAPIAAHFTTLSAFSFLLFNLLCAPCAAAMGAIKREMNNTKWTLAAIGYMCLFAYVTAFIFYQLATMFTQGFTLGSAIAIILVVAVIYLIARKNRYETQPTPHKGTVSM